MKAYVVLWESGDITVYQTKELAISRVMKAGFIFDSSYVDPSPSWIYNEQKDDGHTLICECDYVSDSTNEPVKPIRR